MDITRALHNAENILRDYIDMVLSDCYGDEWYQEAGVEIRKINEWEIRKIPEETGPMIVKGKEKLIQYAKFNDIRKILRENWVSDFQNTFGDQDIMDSFLKIIEEYRDPGSRRRELFVYQKHLILGISGEIRNKISIALSRADTGKEVFPRIESLKDNRGGLWTPGSPRKVKTNQVLKTGDQLEFIVTAYDPMEEDLEYRIFGKKWQINNVILYTVEDGLVGKDRTINVTIRSKRKYHASPHGYDDRISFVYDIVPE
ncbi:MAG: hypothetical protein ACI8XB_000092 [Patiriisocius sp.]|jgi:hypothetical protein